MEMTTFVAIIIITLSDIGVFYLGRLIQCSRDQGQKIELNYDSNEN